MKKIAQEIKGRGGQRRSFLKLAGLSTLGLSMGFPLNTRWAEASTIETNALLDGKIWKKDPATGLTYFVQNNLNLGPNSQWVNDPVNPYVLAKYEGWWWAYPVRAFDEEFHNWWIYEKNWYYNRLIAYFNDETDSMEVPNGGHHHPMLTTYGSKHRNRGDSKFHLNTTPKGFTIIPKVDKIDEINAKIDEAYEVGPIPQKVFETRRDLYADKTLWDKTKFATLELYTGRPINEDDQGNQGGYYGFNETHTFQNLIVNPMSTLSYMSLYNTDGTQTYFAGTTDETATFEFRGFSRLIHNYNPNNTEYETAIHNYINQAHCRYHGGSCEISTNIFIISEEFNNSPGYDPYARGKRVVPPPEPGLYSNTAKNLAALRNEFNNKNKTKSEKIELLKHLKIPV